MTDVSRKYSHAFGYLVQRDGNVISDETAASMVNTGRTLFLSLRERLGDKKLPKSWDHDATYETRKYFYDELEATYEFLRFCDYQWKAEALMIAVYPRYKSHLNKRLQKEKQKKAREASLGADVDPASMPNTDDEDDDSPPAVDQEERDPDAPATNSTEPSAGQKRKDRPTTSAEGPDRRQRPKTVPSVVVPRVNAL